MGERESEETIRLPRSPQAAPERSGASSANAAALSAALKSASALDHGQFLPGTMLADRYRIVALLGRGGMGEVYRADDLTLQQPVALKFLPESLALNPVALARFHGEVRIARQITHPNVCRVYDIGEWEGMHFLSMEYVQGEDLASLLRRIGKLPQEKAVEMARQLAAGLAAAHNAGVIHQDLKPANVLIDARGRVRITDFGVAQVASQARDPSVIAGTPAYMAPERLNGRGSSVQSDIYSLGLVLYEIFTGKALTNPRADARQLTDRPAEEARPRPADLENLDPAIERLILRCLEEDPQLRPRSAIAVLAALPGGDPLEASVAAGHTPSPEMVAAAGGVGAISLRRGLVLLIATLAGLAILGTLNEFATDATRRIPVSIHPAILADRASQFLRQWYLKPAYSEYGLDWDHEYADWLAQNQVKSGEGGGYFWYRESPMPILPYFPIAEPTPADPPPLTPGMISVMLDAHGNLLRFLAIGPARIEAPGAAKPFDWVPFFLKAGLSIKDFNPADPIQNSSTGADRRYAWTGKDPEHPPVALRVEAASLEGEPLYYAVLRPWELHPGEPGAAGPLAERLLQASGFLIRWLALAVAAVITIGNLRRRRADRRGALRVAMYVVLIDFVAVMLRARHGGLVVSEVYRLNAMIGYCLQAGLSCWVLYMALEPYLRRQWPHLLISLSRLVGGQVRDPLVGRDVLVGILCAVTAAIPFTLVMLTGQHFGITYPRGLLDKPMANVSLRETLGILLWYPFADSTFTSLLDLFVLVAALLLTRNRRGAAIAVFVGLEFLLTGGLVATGNTLAGATIAAIITAGLVFTLVRFGVLAMMAAICCGYVLLVFPLTFDLSAWYAPNAFLTTGIIVSIAFYAFHLATEGRWLLSQ